jgi:hypothetical protein
MSRISQLPFHDGTGGGMPRVFISYRRIDAPGEAGRLADHLRERFGEDRVFIDVDSIHAGDDFAHVIDGELAMCSAMLVVIGKTWAQCSDAMGRRKLEDPQDFVRLEVDTALRRNVRLVPVLVRGAVLPTADSLPVALRPLLRHQAFVLDDTHFRSDVDRLIAALEGRRLNPRWVGAAIAGLCVLALGAILPIHPPAHAPLGTARVVVRVHGPGGIGDVARGPGSVKLDGPDAASRSRPLVDGEAIFDDVPADAPGHQVAVSIDGIPGFQATTERRVVPGDGRLDVALARVETTSKVDGTVLGMDDQPLAGAVVIFNNDLVSAITNQHGAFHTEVPVPPQATVRVTVMFQGRKIFRDNLSVSGTFILKENP